MAKAKRKPTDEPADEARRLAVDVHCAACEHDWTLCYMPIPLKDLARFKDIPCPKCFKGPVILGWSARWQREIDALTKERIAKAVAAAAESQPTEVAT